LQTIKQQLVLLGNGFSAKSAYLTTKNIGLVVSNIVYLYK